MEGKKTSPKTINNKKSFQKIKAKKNILKIKIRIFICIHAYNC